MIPRRLGVPCDHTECLAHAGNHRGTMPPMLDRTVPARRLGHPRRPARRRHLGGARRGSRTRPRDPTGRRGDPPRLDVRAPADPRDPRGVARVVVGCPSGGCGAPGEPGPASTNGRVRGGLVALAFALLSGIDRYDTTLFSVHMAQHVLLTLVAAPLIALAAPDHAAAPGRVAGRASPMDPADPPLPGDARPGLPGRRMADLRRGAVGEPLLAAVRRGARGSVRPRPRARPRTLSPHCCSGGRPSRLDPAPWRMPHPARALYVFLQMPQNTFLAVVLVDAHGRLYPHYATLGRSWGPTPLADQQMAGGFMWVVGDLVFLTAILAIVAAWMRHEERDTARGRPARRRRAGRHPRARGAARRAARRDERGERGEPDAQPGAAPRGSSRYCSGSTLPPLTTATTALDAAIDAHSAARKRAPRSRSAPDGSTTRRARSARAARRRRSPPRSR